MQINLPELASLIIGVMFLFFLLPWLGTKIGNSPKLFYFGKDKKYL